MLSVFRAVRRRGLNALLGFLVGGCFSTVEYGDAAVSCATDNVCPNEFFCDTDVGLCVRGSSNQPAAPSLSLGTVAPSSGVRYVSLVEIPFTVDDPNVAGGDSVTVAFEFSTDSGVTWRSATPALALPAFVERRASARYQWDAMADAETQTSGLSADPAGFVDLIDSVLVRAIATDSTGRTSSLEQSLPFSLGNSVPLTSVEPFEAELYGGLIPVTLTLTDASMDTVDIDLQFRLDPSSPWQDALVPLDLLTAAPTQPDGEFYIVTWDSAADAAGALPAQRADGVQVRARSIDSPDGEAQFAGPWSEVQTISSIRNQNPPEILELEVLRETRLEGVAPFAVSFRIADSESDFADVKAELSLDGGDTWIAAREFADPRSEGFLDLATAPRSVDGFGGGVLHTLMLDPAGIGVVPTERRVRLLVTDGFPAGDPVVSIATASVGIMGAPYRFSINTTIDIDGLGFAAAIGDFVGSDAVDVALCETDELKIYAGNGDGTFGFPTAAITRSAGVFPRDLVAADFDDDGDLDLASVDSSSGQVRIYLAANAFNPQVTNVGTDPEGLVVGEFNGVVGPDLATANGTGASISVLAGDNAGAFAVIDTLVAESDVVALTAADFDGDGDLDIAGTEGDGVRVFLNAGTGLFATGAAVGLEGDATQLISGDFDGDGEPELMAGISSETLVAFLENDGAGNFRLERLFPLDIGAEFVGAASADLDADGSADAIFLGASDFYVFPDEGIRSGSGSPIRFDSSLESRDLEVADLDGDGVLDVFVVSTGFADGEDQVTVALAQTAPFEFRSGERTAVVEQHEDVQIVDTDLDGVRDIVVSNHDRSVGVLRGQGQTGFGSGRFVNDLLLVGTPDVEDVVVIDINQDLWPDVIAADADEDEVDIWLGSATGEFSQIESVPTGNLPFEVAADDFNRDGVVDLVTADRVSDTLTVMIGTLAGSVWSAPATINIALGSSSQPVDVVTGDFDGDGLRDLATGFSSSIQVRYGDGSGAFSSGSTRSLSTSVFEIAPADLDSDGRDDLVVIGGVNTQVVLSTALRGFFLVSPTTYPCDGSAIETGDLNGDGVVDFVSGEDVGTGVCVQLGVPGTALGSGVFDAVALSVLAPNSLGIGDANSDGLAELVVVADDQVDVLWGDASQLFADVGVEIESAPEWIPESTRFAIGDGPTLTLGRRPVLTEVVRRGLETLRGLPPPDGLIPATRAERIDGDMKLVRLPAQSVVIGSSTGDRLLYLPRLGSRDSGGELTGLDLDATPARGIVVELPLLDARVSNVLAGDPLRLFLGVPDWVRASQLPSDPLSDLEGASEFLPRVPSAEGFRDVLVETSSWVEIARDEDDDLSTGSGRRYVVDINNESIRVFTDRLGWFQAFLEL